MQTFTAERLERHAMTRNGFTLVELMVVITLVALAGAAVVMTMSSGADAASTTASRFASRLGAARDEAIITGTPVSAWISPSGYGFERFVEGQWAAIEEKPLESSDWPEGVSVSGSAQASTHRSRIRFDAMGLTGSSASLRFAHAGTRSEVRVEPSGDIVVR
jgi:general secretion pathway protein H